MARTVSKVSLTFLAIILITLIVFWQSKVADQDLTNLDAFDDIKRPLTSSSSSSSSAFSKAQVYAKPLNNDTIRAILGSSTWTLLHTMAARFPPEPTIEMQLEYAQFLNLLAKMYPCGQCARHFQGLLKQYPPKARLFLSLPP